MAGILHSATVMIQLDKAPCTVFAHSALDPLLQCTALLQSCINLLMVRDIARHAVDMHLRSTQTLMPHEGIGGGGVRGRGKGVNVHTDMQWA